MKQTVGKTIVILNEVKKPAVILSTAKNLIAKGCFATLNMTDAYAPLETSRVYNTLVASSTRPPF